MEGARSWVTTRYNRLGICVVRGLAIPARAARLQAVCAQNRSLVQTHWGLCAQKEKEKQESIFFLWFSLCSLIPQRAVTATQTQHLGAERAPRSFPTTPALSPPLPQTLGQASSTGPRPDGTAQSWAGHASTDPISAVPSPAAHVTCPVPLCPCAASCPMPAAPPPRPVP